jgi:hypothetical protein
MPSKVIRLDEDAVALCLKYGKTVSEGIRAMDAKITEQQSTEKPLDQKALEKMIRSCIREELEVLSRGY